MDTPTPKNTLFNNTQKTFLLFGVISVLISACVGVDIIEPSEEMIEKKSPEIIFTDSIDNILIEDTFTFSAKYYDSTGSEVSVTFDWSSSNTSVLSIDSAGKVIGVSPGVSTVSASANGTITSHVVTVEEDLSQLSSLIIEAPQLSMLPQAQLQVSVFGLNGLSDTINNIKVTWHSSDTLVATINSDGLITSRGVDSVTTIYALSHDSVKSNELEIRVVSDTDELSEVDISAPVAIIAIGDTLVFSAIGKTVNGEVVDSLTYEWISDNPSVASINIQGVLTGLTAGSVDIYAMAEGTSITSATSTITIYDPNMITDIVISSGATSLTLGESLQFNVNATNFIGGNIIDPVVTWDSDNQAALTINGSGLAMTSGVGIANVSASAGNVNSNAITITINDSIITERTGIFQGASGYSAVGTAVLRIDDVSGDLILDLSDDFSTDFALGTFLYLANSTNGTTVNAAGFEIADISSSVSGASSYNITQLDPGVDINDYQYVVVLCEPFTITFGFAELN